MRRIAAFLLVAAGLACGKAPAPEKPAQPAAARPAPQALDRIPMVADAVIDFDADNLLNVAYGASVVSRTAELGLESSAAHAIDGIPSSYWNSPPGGPSQTIVFSLHGRSRIERLGILPTAGEEQTPAKVRFEASLDGRTWHEVFVLEPRAAKEPVLSDVRPFEAQYLRVTTEETADYYAFLRSVYAIGAEIRRPQPSVLEGCWKVNQLPARFIQEGARVAGVVETEPPTFFEGGTDGRVARLFWTRGPMWGHAALTVTPDATRLTILPFHEEFDSKHLGAAYFGERCGAGDAPSARVPGIAAGELMERTGRLTLYGLAFDSSGRLLEEPSAAALAAIATAIASPPSQRYRVIAHELLAPAAEQNQARSAAQIESIRTALKKRGVDLSRVDFVAAGSSWSGPPVDYALQKLLASRIDLVRAP